MTQTSYQTSYETMKIPVRIIMRRPTTNFLITRNTRILDRNLISMKSQETISSYRPPTVTRSLPNVSMQDQSLIKLTN
jgi:hypothetical protein